MEIKLYNRAHFKRFQIRSGGGGSGHSCWGRVFAPHFLTRSDLKIFETDSVAKFDFHLELFWDTLYLIKILLQFKRDLMESKQVRM